MTSTCLMMWSILKPKKAVGGWNRFSQHRLSAGEGFNTSFCSREADLKRALLELGGTVLQQVTEALSSPGGGGGGGDLPQESQNLLRGQISDLWKNNHPVRTLIGQAWTQEEVISLQTSQYCWILTDPLKDNFNSRKHRTISLYVLLNLHVCCCVTFTFFPLSINRRRESSGLPPGHAAGRLG